IENGRRASAATAYLRPAMKRPNLEIITNALAIRIVLQDGRATGLEYRHGDATLKVSARREVILAGGVINSPQLLMLSGIGPAPQLAAHGIEIGVEQPQVGLNLQDH